MFLCFVDVGWLKIIFFKIVCSYSIGYKLSFFKYMESRSEVGVIFLLFLLFFIGNCVGSYIGFFFIIFLGIS